jgi:hypothetical protein
VPYKSKSRKQAYMREYRKHNAAILLDNDRRYYREHREERKQSMHLYWEVNRVLLNEKNRVRRKQLRQEILDAYGNKCVCCKERNEKFLSIDHVYGQAQKHYKEIGGKDRLYYWLKQQGFPKREFRLMCFNCNFGRAKNGGICPHKEK